MNWSKEKIKEVRKGIVKGSVITEEQEQMLADLGIVYDPEDDYKCQWVQFKIDRYLQARTKRAKSSRKLSHQRQTAS